MPFQGNCRVRQEQVKHKNCNIQFGRYNGAFLVITGIIHTLYALFLRKDAFAKYSKID